MDKIQNELIKIVDNIRQQHIRLINLTLNANDSIGGVFTEKRINSNLKVSIDEISSGSIITDQNKTLPTISCKYKFLLNYSLKEKDEDSKIAEIDAKYTLQIVLQKKIEELLDLERDKIAQILAAFFNTTGKIIIYPYFRNLSDILMRESGFTLPPLHPLKINE